MSEPRGVVQRFDFSETIPKLYHRTRTDALLAETEYGWSEDAAEAYVFETFEAAERHVVVLRAERVEHCHALVVSAHAEVVRERALRHAAVLAGVEASVRHVEPDEAYERTRKRMGERD